MEQSSTATISVMDSGKQKDGKGWKIAIVIAFVMAVCGIGLSVYSIIQNQKENERIVELEKQVVNNITSVPESNGFELIQYSSGGGYGTQAMSATITVNIDSNGKVTLTNNYDSNVESSFQIDSEKYADLTHYINDHMSVFSVKERDHDDVLDAGSYYLTAKKTGGDEYKTGGYAATLDDDFQQMCSKIIDTIGEEEYNSYVKTVHKLD